MKEGGEWRIWMLSLLIAGNMCIEIANCQLRGDEGDGPQSLGFDDVVRRHDGYVKGEAPTIPQTSFRCNAQPYNPGLYADVETQCQVYHVCFEDRQESFLCGPGTNFNQRILACDFWYNFDCQDSPSFYGANADIGKVPDTVFNQGQERVPKPQQPSFPTFPRQPEQPPSVASIPPRVSIPPPPPRPQPQPQRPAFQPQPQRPVFQPQPQRPVFQPQPQRPAPQPQRPAPQPQRPIPQPQRPVPQPQRPVPQPQRPVPQPPRIRPDTPINIPEPPSFRPQPPAFRPQPPRIQPEQPTFDPPQRIDLKPDYPTDSSGHFSGGGSRIPSSVQQEVDSGYQFDGYQPPKPPSRPQISRPAFPPVVSPPRVSRPPLTPAVVREPEASISRPQRPEYHPDANVKGNNDYRPPRIPQPSTGYPSYPVPQRPITPVRPITPRPVAQRPVERIPPPSIQQEHIDVNIPPPPPKQPSKPNNIYVPPPPPIQKEVEILKPPQRPSRPIFDPVPQRPIEPEYERPQPPVSPSIIREQQKPVVRPPSRPQVSVGSRQPQRPKPVFPPPSDHPNSNIKGGPGYQQPPPQIPRFEPTRIGRPSNPEGGYIAPKPQRPVSVTAVKPVSDFKQTISVSSGYKPPQQERVKIPSEPIREIYQPPIPVIDHPQSEIKGNGYREPVASHQQQRIKSPSAISGIKTAQASTSRQQPQRPRAPIVVARPQPPIIPVKKPSPVHSQQYEKPVSGVKQPSPSQNRRTTQPRIPIDHPNANIKGIQSRPQINRPSHRDDAQIIRQPDYKPQRRPSANTISGVKTIPASHQRQQQNPDYGTGSSYTQGPDIYPKPEFGQPSRPYQPISTPSRSQSVKQASPSQNQISRSQNKPVLSRPSVATASGGAVRPDNSFNRVPGYQPANDRQVFPHRENPDHPNESLKGSGAYRPPPPAGFQSAASEAAENKVPAPESAALFGDIGAE